MKQRIFAFLLAIVMVFSMFALASCDKKGADDEGEGEESSAPLTTKELFVASMVNTISGGSFESIASMMKLDDIKATVKVDLNKLVVDGTDFLDGNKASAELTGAIDLDNKAIELKANASIFGEKPSASLIMDTEAIYVVDVAGLNKKPIKLTYEEMDLDIDEILGGLDMAEEELDKYTDVVESIVKIFTDAIEANFSDDSFEQETKTVTVEGTEFKDATVLTLVIDAEKMKAFCDDIITGVLENETLKEITGGEDVDKEALLEDFDEFGHITIVNTIVDKKTVALDVEIKALADEAETEDYDEDGAAVAQRVGTHLMLKSTFVGDNFKIHVGIPDDNGEFDATQGIFKFERTVTGTDELIELYLEQDGDKEVFLKFDGTYENGKHDGTLFVTANGTEMSLKCAYEGNSADCKLTISNFKIVSASKTFEMPGTYEIAYKFGKGKTEMTVGIKYDARGTQIDAVISLTEEMSDVNISAPTNAVTIDELDQDEVLGWLEDAQKKFPKIFGYIEDMMTGSNEDASNESYYDDYYDDDYDFDYEGGFASGF